MPSSPPDDSRPREFAERAARAKQHLREAAARGDREARRTLADLGEPAPPPRHWSEPDEDEAEGFA